jgi:cytoplasmic iron level regulating protein YaaA (DUF328/UPF0246 family)
VLILLPASEAKRSVSRGAPLDLTRLSFPTLTPTRAAVLEALIEVSAEADATRPLGVPATMADAVKRNVSLHDAPTADVGEVYAGAVYKALCLTELETSAQRQVARSSIVIISALWGAVRPGDRVPPYRLNMCGRLPGLAHLPDVWREPLTDVLPDAAGHGVVVDFRAAGYATAWRPSGELADRTVDVKVRHRDGVRGASSYDAKRTAGLVVRHLVTADVDPAGSADLADALAGYFDVDLRRPERPGKVWTLHVVAVP